MVYRKIASAWMDSRRGRIVLGAWAVTFVGVTVNAAISRHLARKRLAASKAKEEAKQPTKQQQATSSSPAAAEAADADEDNADASADAENESAEADAEDTAMVATAAPSGWRAYLTIAMGRRRAWPYIVLFTVGAVAKCLVSIQVSRQIGKMGSLVARGDWAGVYDSQISFAMWCVPAAITAALSSYWTKRLALGMRTNLVEHLNEATTKSGNRRRMAAAKGALEHPDAVATEDTRELASSYASFLTGIIRPTVDIVFQSVGLARMMGTPQLLSCYTFFVGSIFWMRSVGPSFKSLSQSLAEEEGAVRASASRALHTYAEEVDMVAASHAEAGIARRAYQRLASVLARYQAREAVSDALNNYVVRYMGILAAYVTMLPTVLQGSSGLTLAGEDPGEYMLTSLHLLVNVGLACRDLALSGRVYGVGKGLADRLGKLEAAVSAPAAQGAAIEGDAAEIVFENVTLAAPDGRELVTGLSFATTGRSVFLCGPNGVGKTTLLKVLAGTASPTTGSVRVPRRCDCFFLPQRFYAVPGTLREQLMYPHTLDLSDDVALQSYEAYGDDCPLRAIDDAAMVSVLKLVGLEALTQCDDALDRTDACKGLSTGEQQRLGIARMLLQRPRWAMLDECTNALTEEFERWVYTYCNEQGITLITVSHRSALAQYHDHVLRLNPAPEAASFTSA